MFRKTFLLTAAACYFLGISSGVVLERGTGPTDGLATTAGAAEPESAVRTTAIDIQADRQEHALS